MPNWRVVPIETWPGEQTKDRKDHPFRTEGRFGSTRGVNWGATMDLLDRELRQLRARDILLQMAVEDKDIRLDGWIRAAARPSHPGVILSFESKFGPLSYPCDNFRDWQANVRAIALALEALRKVDRYGVTKRGEQYTGWKRLPAQVQGGPHAVLAQHARLSEAEVREDPRKAYRQAARNTHPDHGGSGKEFSEVGEAARMIGVGNG